MSTVRAFIAIPLPPEVREAARAFTALLKPHAGDAKWEQPDKLHLTLRFLGDTEELRIPAVLRAIEASASAVRPFTMIVSGFGAFPSLRRPRVLWIGCSDAGGSLATLHRALGDELALIGIPPEDRPFHPHITIARRRGEGVHPHLTSLPENVNFEAHHAPVTEIFLMRSVLQPEGSEYSVIGSSRFS